MKESGLGPVTVGIRNYFGLAGNNGNERCRQRSRNIKDFLKCIRKPKNKRK